MRKLLAAGIACVLTLSAASIVAAQQAVSTPAEAASSALGFGHGGHGNKDPRTATPIKHLVVIFQENVSFDHYFGTYPFAANPSGEPAFYARPFTPPVNGLSHALLTANPTVSNPGNGDAAINPFRLARAQAATADQDHGYTLGTARLRRRQDGSLSAVHRSRRSAAGRRCLAGRQGPGDGLLRRQHRHRAVELCAELRHERQQLRHGFRPVFAGRGEPHRRPDRRRRRHPQRHRRRDRRRPWRPHDDRRPRPDRRHLLFTHGQPGDHGRPQHRRPAQRPSYHVGLVPGRLRRHPHQRRRQHRLHAPDAVEDHQRQLQRLQSASRAVPVLPPRRPIPRTRVLPPSRPSARPTRPTTSTTSRTSTTPSTRTTCLR